MLNVDLCICLVLDDTGMPGSGMWLSGRVHDSYVRYWVRSLERKVGETGDREEIEEREARNNSLLVLYELAYFL